MADDNGNGLMSTIPWYRSKIIQRLALSIVIQALAVMHLSKFITPDLAILVDDALEIVGIALAGWAVHARVVNPVPPVALNKKSADAANVANSTPLVQPKENT